MRTSTKAELPDSVTVTAPTEVWAALFLRDFLAVDIAPNIPHCDPAPLFDSRESVATPAHLLAIQENLELRLGHVASVRSDESLRVFQIIEVYSQLDAWRRWRDLSKLEIQELESSLDCSPSWLSRRELASHSPSITSIVVLPVAGDYSERRDATICVSLNLFRDVEALRAEIRSLK